MKNLMIFKNDKKSEKQPDYRICISDGTNIVEVGAGWVKEGAKAKYISCKLQDVYVDHTKGARRDGYHLAKDEITETAKTYTANYKPDPDDVITIADIPV